MNDYHNDYNSGYREQGSLEGFSAYLSRVFSWMFLGLAVSFATAYMVARSETMLRMIFSSSFTVIFLLLVEFGLVMFLSSRITKLSFVTASSLFLVYSFLNGLTLSAIFIVYAMNTLASAFLTASLLFGVMAIYGKVTKRDLSGLGSFFMMGLIGIIISLFINFFLQSDAFDFVISGIGVFVFAGLTAYDMQKLKHYYYAYGDTSIAGNIAVSGALQLYLDFINLFLFLLRLFGRRD